MMDFSLRVFSAGFRFSLAAGRLVTGLLLVAAPLALSAQKAATPVVIDASQPWVAPVAAPYDLGSAKSPVGAVLGLDSRSLTINGQPWLPVMGEFHFSRVPRDQWDDELMKMKAAGVNIVATYVIWIHHEESKGQYDWTGERDLRVFAGLCQKHGLYMVARIGPWDHAEARNGGLPDWVLRQGPTRVNDPVYLASVRDWYAQIGLQLKGLLWKDGGPVIAVQLENEYHKRGANAGEAHMLELKKIALANGLDVPYYFATAWDNAVIPPRAVLPVHGGYPDAPWDDKIGKLAPAEIYAFRFDNRVAANLKPAALEANALPFLTAEIGGGIEDTYHRRPVIAPDDIAAELPVLIGSGVNLYGMYMFQGGENPDGKLSTLQESQKSGYPNDVPIKSYDFQAPLGEFGQERASLRKLKVFDYFLNDFGAELAPMTVHAPAVVPRDTADLSVPRAAVRSRGDSGFLFVNNYLRGHAMPTRKAAQFEIRLPQGTLALPRHPVDLPTGAYFIWPFNFHVEGINLRYSTTQLFTRLDVAGVATIYFTAVPGIAAEFAFDAATVRSIKPASGTVERDGGVLYLTGARPGVDTAIDIVSAEGKPLRLVLLTAQEAENAWKVRIGGTDHLLITDKDLITDSGEQSAHIQLRSRDDAHFAFTITPPPAAPLRASLPLAQTPQSNAYAVYFSAEATPRQSPPLQVHPTQSAGLVPPVPLGPPRDKKGTRVAQAPDEGELPQAAKWEVTVPVKALDGLDELYLELGYRGDLARLSDNGKLLSDNFYNGQPWAVGLKRFVKPQSPTALSLSILPLRKDAPVYFELASPLAFAPNGQVGELDSIRLVPEYELEITAAASH
jgi:hypothetical protein